MDPNDCYVPEHVTATADNKWLREELDSVRRAARNVIDAWDEGYLAAEERGETIERLREVVE